MAIFNEPQNLSINIFPLRVRVSKKGGATSGMAPPGRELHMSSVGLAAGIRAHKGYRFSTT